MRWLLKDEELHHVSGEQKQTRAVVVRVAYDVLERVGQRNFNHVAYGVAQVGHVAVGGVGDGFLEKVQDGLEQGRALMIAGEARFAAA